MMGGFRGIWLDRGRGLMWGGGKTIMVGMGSDSWGLGRKMVARVGRRWIGNMRVDKAF